MSRDATLIVRGNLDRKSINRGFDGRLTRLERRPPLYIYTNAQQQTIGHSVLIRVGDGDEYKGRARRGNQITSENIPGASLIKEFWTLANSKAGRVRAINEGF